MPSSEPFRPWLFVPEIVAPYDPRLRPLPPPDTGIFDCPQVQICINSKWVSHLDGLIERLAFRDAWLASEAETDRAIGEITKLLAALKVDNMSCCCDDAQKIYRYDADGNLEVSTDGGETWEDAPQDDPRLNSTTAPPLPGPDGADKRCQAAASATEFISSQFVDEIEDAMTVGQIVALFAAILAMILSLPAGAILGPLIVTIVGNIINVGASIIQSAFDSTQKSLLQCILYCRAADDGSFNQAAWEGVKADIMAQMAEAVAIFLRDAVNVMGPVGLTNASRMGLLSGITDCSACDCPYDCFEPAGGITTGTVTATGNVDPSGQPYIEVEAATFGGPGYAVAWGEYGQPSPPNVCCYLFAMVELEGDVLSSEWHDCAGGQHTSPAPEGHMLGHFAYYNASAPFKVRLIFGTP